jgi:hypothetical protein
VAVVVVVVAALGRRKARAEMRPAAMPVAGQPTTALAHRFATATLAHPPSAAGLNNRGNVAERRDP